MMRVDNVRENQSFAYSNRDNPYFDLRVSLISTSLLFSLNRRLIVLLISTAVSQLQTFSISSHLPQGQRTPLIRAIPASGSEKERVNAVLTC